MIMASSIKQKIVKNLYGSIHNKFYKGRYDEFFGAFKLMPLKENKLIWRVEFPFMSTEKLDLNLLKTSQKELLENQSLKDITYSDEYDKHTVNLELDARSFVKDVLDSNPTELNFKPLSKKVIVEFSSPNIAKPFHSGHLRSTIIGNVLANIKQKLGKDVVKINYLGDWGTQFGMIMVGVKLNNYSEEDIQKDPIKMLYNAYVKGNREAERHQETFDEARKIFFELESGNECVIRDWQMYKDWTVKNLTEMYDKLGVSFNEFNWESDYKRKQADVILNMLNEKGILSVDEKNRKVAVIEDKEIPLVKSDDTTLYLMRDLMAVLDRRSKHNFDEMYYVVENGQNLHFSSLFQISQKININDGKKLHHVKFGRIHGMSTRKGNVVFLEDILEEAEKRCREEQEKSKFTKVSSDDREVAEVLGVSAIVLNDLKQRRQKDYEFSWDKTLSVTGETGTHLQYCHCRLASLADNSGITAASDCDPDALTEPEAINLVISITKFEEAIWSSNQQLEPCVLAKYLFQLVKAVNIAFRALNVKNTEEHVASQRLLLFNKSREVLNEGIKLLGLKVLYRM